MVLINFLSIFSYDIGGWVSFTVSTENLLMSIESLMNVIKTVGRKMFLKEFKMRVERKIV